MVRGPIDSGLPGLWYPQETLKSPSPSAEAPRSPCPRPVRGVTLREDGVCSEQSCQLCCRGTPPAAAQLFLAWRHQAWPGPGWGGGASHVEDCLGLAFPCSLKECCRNGPLFGLVFIPQERWSCLAFPRLALCSREGSGTLGTDCPRPGVESRAPIPHLGYRMEVQSSCHPSGSLGCCWDLCKKKGGCLPPSPKPLMDILPGGG